MAVIVVLLDLFIVAAALVSTALWMMASRQRARRVSRHDVLDAADMNRIITMLNRTQILNARAALATAVATLLAGARVFLDVL